jgi:hypothetical protein
LASGAKGFVSALIGAAIVVVFYLFDLAALKVAERRHGSALMPIMLTGYVIKVAFLAILIARLWQSTDINMEALAATVVAATITWTSALAVVATRAATFFVSVEVEPHTELDGANIKKETNTPPDGRLTDGS